MSTTQVTIVPTEYTAVATAGQGPGVFTAAVRGGAFFRIGASKPSNSAEGHYVPYREALDLTTQLSAGKSLWARSVLEGVAGNCIITLDSVV